MRSLSLPSLGEVWIATFDPVQGHEQSKSLSVSRLHRKLGILDQSTVEQVRALVGRFIDR